MTLNRRRQVHDLDPIAFTQSNGFPLGSANYLSIVLNCNSLDGKIKLGEQLG
jgi:hypothetical protein